METKLNEVSAPGATVHRVRHQDGIERQFEGRLLGFGTSRMDSHIHPIGPPPPGLRCSGCRWVEARIWWSDTNSCYVIGIKGHTTVPGEEHRYRSWWATAPAGVLDALLVRPPARRAALLPEGARELPQANYEALVQAADLDDALAMVLDNWEDEQ